MRERRFTRGTEVRTKGDDAKPGLEGYAAVFNQDYVLYEDTGMRWVEKIKPGAFSRVLKEKQDVRALFNHNADHVLARTTNGTLVLAQDSQGLSYDAALDSRTRIAQDVRCFVDRKDVTGCSFSFRVGKQVWREEEQSDGKMTIYTREIEEISELYDVGPVTYPAYEGTSVGARALAHQLRSLDGLAPELRSRMLARAERADSNDEESDCGCRCDACSRCENKRSHSHGEHRGGCECDCKGCVGGDCDKCSNDPCGEKNCRCGRSAANVQEKAKARTRALQAELTL